MTDRQPFADVDAVTLAFCQGAQICTTDCDDDCDALCHEWHQPTHRRDHQPNACPSAARNHL